MPCGCTKKQTCREHVKQIAEIYAESQGVMVALYVDSQGIWQFIEVDTPEFAAIHPVEFISQYQRAKTQ